uniref:ANK_REP_REGION domain-containing protein n=1 Tax=Meloidogyne hapla TaxID=6305 RepID=A0A1I8BLY7_MELHA
MEQRSIHRDHGDLHFFSNEESSSSNIPSNVYEYFQLVEDGKFPFFNNTQVHVSAMRNSAGETLLNAAARLGHHEIVERLVGDIDVEETDYDGWTALLNASHHGFADVVRTLLNAGASIENPDLMGWTSLMWACYKNRPEVVDVLIEFKAHVNIVGEEDGLTPLIIASGRGFVELVPKLLEAGAQVNTSDKFGSTALIWAARKGHLQIVQYLLNSGAELDAVGMQASSALMLATRGNYISVVEALLAREPNVNIVDYNGLSALGIAAREGYTEIAASLLQSGAFVNTVDRFGNSILANAVRSGNINLVRMLLERHADVNAKDSEGRTPLHLAIDKNYSDIVLALLEKKPNLELKNRDGDTALLRAIKNRDVQVTQLLVSMGAKLSTTDNAGDNALHLALRARSRRLTQILLVNPSDSKLLYRPNKLGETPYSIDQESPQPILPTIFGPFGTEVDLKSLLGFDSYGDVIADVVCEPNLSLPLTIGLYAKWGSGKSILLSRIRNSMKSFSRTWLDGIELYWSWSLILITLLISALVTLLSAALFSIVQEGNELFFSLGVGLGMFLLFLCAYSFIYYGSEVRLWNGSISAARLLARTFARFKLMLSVLTLNAPTRGTEKEIHEKKLISPVSFLFADNHRLKHYGTLAVRLFTSFKQSQNAEHSSKLQSICGIPVLLIILMFPLSLAISSLLFIQNQHLVASVFLTFSVISGTVLLYVLSIRLVINLPKHRIARIINRIHLQPFERMLQKLQKEVDLLVSLVTTLDAFINSQTRLVIMVDGLDSCEQNKMVQLLDAFNLFFCSRQNAPFVVLLALDRNIIISTIQQNLRSSGSENEITGRDYLKNIVTMPFFLDHIVALRRMRNQQNAKKMALDVNNLSALPLKDRIRSDTFLGSKMSLRATDRTDSAGVGGISTNVNEISHFSPSFDLFANINPRTLRRIVNSIALTGRLLRVFEVEFNWWQVYAWVSLIEQWPWRMCWLIDVACSLQDDSLLLYELYCQLKSRISIREGMEDLDRNSSEFESVFRKLCAGKQNQLTVGHARSFAPCTSNLDPYMRRLIREQRGGEPLVDLAEETEEQEKGGGGGSSHDPFGPLKELLGSEAEFLFDDPLVWASISKPLARMSVNEIDILMKRLNISKDKVQNVGETLIKHNLNGLALHSCNLDELRNVLNLPLGDWTLFQLFITCMRKWKPFITQSLTATLGTSNSATTTTETECKSPSERPTPLRSIIEEDGAQSTPLSILEREKSPEGEREEEDDDNDEDTNSVASVAGSEHCLLKTSNAPLME